MQSMDSVVMQLEQNMSGMYGDYMGVALATAGAVAAVLRPFQKFASLLTSTAFMINADIILFCAVALWTQGGHAIYHNHLILLLFLASTFLRFSTTWPNDGAVSAQTFQALVNRSLRRVSEYTIIIFPACAMMGNYAGSTSGSGVFIASSAVFVASARSYEGFRSWRLHQTRAQLKSPSEEAQIRQLVHYFRQDAGASPTRHDENASPNLLPFRRRTANRCGNYETQRHAFDLAFLWLHGSAPLIISAVVLLSSIITTMDSAASHGFLAVWIKVLYIIALGYLLCRPFAGLVAWAVTDIRIAARSCGCCRDVNSSGRRRHRTLTGCELDTHVNNIKLWASDMWQFWLSSAGASADLPVRCKSVPDWLSRLIGYVEGAELSLHIAIAFQSRLICDGILVYVLYLAYSFQCFLRCRAIDRLRRRRKKEGATATGGDGTASVSVKTNDVQEENIARDVAASATTVVKRLSLSRLTYMICRSQLQLFDQMYPPGQPSYVILGVQFIQMNTTSKYNMRTPIDFPQRDIEPHDYKIKNLMVGYCWLEKGDKITEDDDSKGYAYLKGKCLQLPWDMECERAYKYGLRGGWITIDDKLNEKLYMWGDTCVDDNGSIEEVGHFYAGVLYGDYLRKDATHPDYSKPSEIRVWFKFGYNPIRISHIWRDEKCLLPKCSCYPSANDPNVKCLAPDVSSYPELSAFQIALVP